MKATFFFCAIALLICGQSFAMHEKLVEKWAQKIMKIQFMHKCWGHKSMMKWHHKMEELQEECMQLTPSFEINLFENDEDATNDFFEGDDNDDDEYDPFISGNAVDSNAGFQSLPATLPFRGANGQPMNPYEAFAAFFAQAQAQAAKASRNKRSPGKKPTAADFRKMAGQISEFKEQMKHNIGNLTCVMAKMGQLDGNLDIKLEFFTEKIWDMFDADEQPDYEFKEKVIKGYEHCHRFCQSIPQDLLEEKGPMYAQFGRMKMFYKCAMKMEKEMCVKKELHEWVSMMIGKENGDNSGLRRRLGLPDDKYDAPLMAMTVKMMNKTPVQKFIMKFMMGE